mgnify:CR=1 FL=1
MAVLVVTAIFAASVVVVDDQVDVQINGVGHLAHGLLLRTHLSLDLLIEVSLLDRFSLLGEFVYDLLPLVGYHPRCCLDAVR